MDARTSTGLLASTVKRVLSLGAGVQSSTLAMMYASGELPPIDAAIFADTQEETNRVYDWLDWLDEEIQGSLYPYPIYRVTRGALWKSATEVRTTRDLQRTYIKTAVPVFMLDGLKRGLGQRHCTRDFKILVIERKARELTGLRRISKKAGVLVEMLIGISTDEADRMKPSQRPWITTSWPLIDANMDREACVRWMVEHGYPTPPRSACVACPFHSDDEWLALDPQEFRKAVQQEKDLQRAYASVSEIHSVPFLHESRVPLSEVAFKRGAGAKQLNKFRNECEGMCGV